MAKSNKKRGFRHSLTFKILCGMAVLFVLGIIYNMIVAEDAEVASEIKEEEEMRKAALDTLDIIGDYLWPNAKPVVSKDTAAVKKEEDRKGDERKEDKNEGKTSREIEMPEVQLPPAPAPATDPIPAIDPKPSAPTVEKMDASKVEKIEQ
ncbi:hypothetical protein [Prevotella sp. HUN102]|uniref:hypothetical protein n=1 Tax=Prevotella sp. HUN102 TaxID=1392486 RepID=UPI00048DC64A|nr:hypothetical protein [Prevotella sp. HUN102]